MRRELHAALRNRTHNFIEQSSLLPALVAGFFFAPRANI